MKNILLAFIPIFVAVDAIGVLPLFVSFTDGLDQKRRAQVILQSMVTAICLATFFIFLGKAIFGFLGVTVGDFMIAGGAILFCIAINDIMNASKKRRLPVNEMGAVPLGTPLIVGPAVLTTSLMLISECGVFATLLSVVVNVLLAGLIFYYSSLFMRVLGRNGSKAVSKVASLLLAAIAVVMVRKGIMLLIKVCA